MDTLETTVQKIAQNIINFEKRLATFSTYLRKLVEQYDLSKIQAGESGEIAGGKLTEKVEPAPFQDLTVAGVDGGMVQKTYHDLDLILTRAIAAIFRYQNNNLLQANYYPSPITPPKPQVVTEPIANRDLGLKASIERQKTELDLAIKIVEKHDLDLLLVDGSLVPHQSSKPYPKSKMWTEYRELLKRFQTLYKNCRKTHTFLVGIIKDSRGTRFSNILHTQIISHLTSELDKETIRILKKNSDILLQIKDTHLLHHILEVGERTCIFRYSEAPREHPALKTIEERKQAWSMLLYSFYLRPVPYDRPLRIEFLAKEKVEETANKIASIIFSSSNLHEGFGYPPVLVEADARAKINRLDLDFIHTQILERAGLISPLMELRRESKPFL